MPSIRSTNARRRRLRLRGTAAWRAERLRGLGVIVMTCDTTSGRDPMWQPDPAVTGRFRIIENVPVRGSGRKIDIDTLPRVDPGETPSPFFKG